MLARRRNAGQRRAPATATSNAGAASGGTSSGAVVDGGSYSATSASLDEIVKDRVAAFAPCDLPSLVKESGIDETVATAGVADDMTLVEGMTRYRARVTEAVLMVYLNIDTDPPDYPRVEPCAKMECWVDPMVAHVAHNSHRSNRGGGVGGSGSRGGSESIAEELERQYRTLLRDEVGVTRVIEAVIDTAQSALVKSRRMARDGRVLIHYNGHGMPRATDFGEVWVFDKERRYYVPLSIRDMAELADTPAIYVMDCNSAGSLLQRWFKDRLQETHPHDLFICACSAGEMLPLSPSLPADMLTSCLTTPLKMALEWYIGFSYHALLLPKVSVDMIRNMPGDLNDRKSPRGELNWILNAVTDTIAWCTLPPAQFHYLFRQDTTVKGLFRNSILADRLLREAGCTPVTHPPLSEEAHLHPMWELWEYTVDKCVSQLPLIMASDSTHPYEPSSFFDGQLTAFEVWVESGDISQVPEQLPCVLLALTQVLYRVRAFTLLSKYLDSGRTAGKRAILCGVLPYMSKLITQAPEVFLIVTVLWMQVIRADPNEGCAEMQKSQCEKYFTSLLKLDESSTTIEYVEYGQAVAYGSAASPVSRTESPSASSPSVAPRLKRHDLNPRSSIWGSTTGLDAGDTATTSFATDMALQPVQPLSSAGPEQGRATADAAAQPIQPSAPPLAPRLNSIANHAVNASNTTYFLMKDVHLPRCKAMSCYVLCQFLQRGERQCILSWNNRLLNAAFPCLSSPHAELRSWACLALSQLFSGLRHAKSFASKECAARLDLFTRLLQDRSPIVRGSCVTLLATIVGIRVDLLPAEQQIRRLQVEKSLLIKLREYVFDASMNVREELIFFASQILHSYRGALPVEMRSQIHEYVLEVGQQSSRWVLEEADVGVKSQLHASRPTVSSLFDDTVVFETSFLTADDPPPPTREVDSAKLSAEALAMMEGLLHDAALLLCILYRNCDSALVNKALRGFSTGAAPQSQRFASEALRTMSRVASMDSADYWSEADRARATWNTDVMKQLVLDMRDRRLEPHRYSSPTSSLTHGHQDPTSTPPTNGRQPLQQNSSSRNSHTRSSGSGGGASGGGRSAPGAPLQSGGTSEEEKRGMSRHLVLRSVIRPDTVICSAFRALEASFVVATKDQRISYISYDNYSSQVLLHSFGVRLSGPLHDLHIINDLSEHSGLLLVNKRGGFSLMKGCWEPNTIPTEAAVFSACPPPSPPNRWLDLKSTYRSNTATLFYGGPIGEDGGTAIHFLSLAEEQVSQRLPVSGNPVLTCLEAHTTQRAVLAGFKDGVVRYYDDRQRQGQVGAVGMITCRPPDAPSGTPAEAVVGTGLLSNSGNNFSICAATRSALYVFDTRKLNEPFLYADTRRLLGAPDGNLPPASITRCSVGVHTGLIALSFQNDTYAAFNAKGLILNDHPLSVLVGGEHSPQPTHSSAHPTTAAPTILPFSCMAHPLRPLMTFGGELVFLQL